MFVLLFSPEPSLAAEAAHLAKTGAREPLSQWFSKAIIGPFCLFHTPPDLARDFAVRLRLQIGQGMAAVMATPAYISLAWILSTKLPLSPKLVAFRDGGWRSDRGLAGGAARNPPRALGVWCSAVVRESLLMFS